MATLSIPPDVNVLLTYYGIRIQAFSVGLSVNDSSASASSSLEQISVGRGVVYSHAYTPVCNERRIF